MLICKVVGHVWATKKEESLEGLKLMVVQEVDLSGNEHGNPFVAADVCGAGVGEQVLTVSGSTARKAFPQGELPVDSAIVAIIDTIEVNRELAEEATKK